MAWKFVELMPTFVELIPRALQRGIGDYVVPFLVITTTIIRRQNRTRNETSAYIPRRWFKFVVFSSVFSQAIETLARIHSAGPGTQDRRYEDRVVEGGRRKPGMARKPSAPRPPRPSRPPRAPPARARRAGGGGGG